MFFSFEEGGPTVPQCDEHETEIQNLKQRVSKNEQKIQQVDRKANRNEALFNLLKERLTSRLDDLQSHFSEKIEAVQDSLKDDIGKIKEDIRGIDRELGEHSSVSNAEDSRIKEKVEGLEGEIENLRGKNNDWPAEDWRPILIFLVGVLTVGFIIGLSVQEISIDKIIEWLFTTQ